VGWACLTNEIKDKELPIDTFLQDIEFTMGWREQMTEAALKRDDWEVLFSVFSTPDRVQHMTFKYADPLHPLHEPEEAARVVSYFGKSIPLSEVIDETYRQVDRVVGEVMAKLKLEDTLMLCADHGFTSFRRQVDVNNWLAENGWLHLQSDLTSRKGRYLHNSIDWTRTQAYSLGLGMVFLNLKGREPKGIVEPAEARAILEAIRERALQLEDPDGVDGPTRAIRDAVLAEDSFAGPYVDRCADLMLGFEEFYRVAWDTAGGKLDLREQDDPDTGRKTVVPDSIFEDNTNNWCGDHASVSPDIVTGIFFSSRPVVVPDGGVNVTHLAPTVLDLVGVPIPGDYDEAALVRR
jgi:predicted AlkP superfamily phosphohydrolase/phosphomutase